MAATMPASASTPTPIRMGTQGTPPPPPPIAEPRACIGSSVEFSSVQVTEFPLTLPLDSVTLPGNRTVVRMSTSSVFPMPMPPASSRPSPSAGPVNTNSSPSRTMLIPSVPENSLSGRSVKLSRMPE